MLPLLGFGERLHAELDDIFIVNPDKAFRMKSPPAICERPAATLATPSCGKTTRASHLSPHGGLGEGIQEEMTIALEAGERLEGPYNFRMADRIFCSCVTCPKCGAWVVVRLQDQLAYSKEKYSAICPAPECGKELARDASLQCRGDQKFSESCAAYDVWDFV